MGWQPASQVLQSNHPNQAPKVQTKLYPQGLPRGGEDESPVDMILQLTNPAHLTSTNESEKQVCSCGKVCKNLRGLKIHMGRMRCQATQSNVQRPSEDLGETEEERNPEPNHSVLSLHVHEDEVTNTAPIASSVSSDPSGKESNIKKDGEIRERVKWPNANKVREWQELDEDLDKILESNLIGIVENKISTMSNMVYNIGCDRFGTLEKRGSKKPGSAYSSKREQKISEIRKELKNLTKLWRQARVNEKQALNELREEHRTTLKSLRRAENNKKNRKKRQQRRTEFLRDPFKFMKKLLGNKTSGELKCSKKELEAYLKTTHTDPNKDVELGECSLILNPNEPTIDFDISEPRFEEIKNVVRKARAGSAPGPSGISYKVYKNCPKLLRRLWKLLRVIWRKGNIPESWKLAEGIFIPKEDKSESIGQFRTISLLSVECKMFFAVVSKRLTDYLINNKYMDTSVQKGGVSGFSGCLEHISVITQLIKEAREGKKDIAVIWLDLANAYGSIPHKLVKKTLTMHHVPAHIIKLINNYYSDFKMRFTTSDFTTEWQKLEVGIITGCTLSVVLFSASMYVLVKAAEKECKGPVMSSGTKQPPTRAFMDDLTVTTKSLIEGRWMLNALETLIKWARMKFKPAKSRSLVLKKGKVSNRFRYEVQGEVIPTITDKPVKSLGKWFNESLKDVTVIKEVVEQLEEWLKIVDKSGLPGRYKAWCYQYGILPRILWPLLVYEFTLTTVEEIERKISSQLRKWLNLTPSLSSIALYSSGNKLQLPLSSVTEEFKVTKARAIMTIEDSSDDKVSTAGIRVRTGRKWKAHEAVSQAKERLHHKEIVGITAVGRQGFGLADRDEMWSKASKKERRKLVQTEVRQIEEETRQAKAVGMAKQGRWTRWEGGVERKLTWPELWEMDPYKLKFLISAVYDVLPTPSNLNTWGLSDSPACKLCGQRGNLSHILSACKKALAQGRYTWRHNQVLAPLAHVLEVERKKKKTRPRKVVKYIGFIKEGGKSNVSATENRGILATANDWQLNVDLYSKLCFPEVILTTNQRPDMVLWSLSTKQVLVIELTVPWEERIEEAHERKFLKYSDLQADCKAKGWKSHCFPVEVGCRGFAGQSVWKLFSALGIYGKIRKSAIKDACESAAKASQWIFRKRDEEWSS